MDYTKLSLINCFNLACRKFGLENEHTICIGHLVEAVNRAKLHLDIATPMAQIIYHHGEESLYYNEAWDDEEYDEPDVDECGFDPYEGCYMGDC